MVPAGALTDLAPGSVARQHVAAGEVIVAHDESPTATPQSLIPDGWLAAAIAEAIPSGARVGDRVTVATGGVVIAGDGVVVGVVGEALLVAIPADAAAARRQRRVDRRRRRAAQAVRSRWRQARYATTASTNTPATTR